MDIDTMPPEQKLYERMSPNVGSEVAELDLFGVDYLSDSQGETRGDCVHAEAKMMKSCA
jgi:hypothetical protein